MRGGGTIGYGRDMARIPTKVLAAAIGLAGGAALGAGARLRRGRRATRAADTLQPAPPPTAAGAVVPVGSQPPPEVPGPSVTAPAAPMSETERAELVDELRPTRLPGDLDAPSPDEALVADEEAAAAAEAAMIGGPAPPEPEADADPAMRPVYEGGGGEQEGFEAAEADLIENATHGEGRANPLRDAIAPEAESDRSTAEYAETDQEEAPDR